jgi:hypothetical protein
MEHLLLRADANNDYSSSNASQNQMNSNTQQSKNQYGTLTATADANNDYSSSTQSQNQSKQKNNKKTKHLLQNMMPITITNKILVFYMAA